MGATPVLAGGYWIWRAWYDGDYTTLIVFGVILVLAVIVDYPLRRWRR
ncbi:MAG: hypothetical protein WBO08_18790 [Mycobacterium sp.]|nr:hypothetical protein [Mycobacterium sp.]